MHSLEDADVEARQDLAYTTFVQPPEIRYNLFKIRDYSNKSAESCKMKTQGHTEIQGASSQEKGEKVITYKELYRFKDRYEITRKTVENRQLFKGNDSLNVTDMTQ